VIKASMPRLSSTPVIEGNEICLIYEILDLCHKAGSSSRKPNLSDLLPPLSKIPAPQFEEIAKNFVLTNYPVNSDSSCR
jgi:hypothetical protein